MKDCFRRQGGLTLVEVVMSVVLIAIAFPALSQLFTGIVVTAQRPAFITTANYLCVGEAETLLGDHRSRDTVNFGYRNLTAAKYPDQAITGYTGYSRQIRITEAAGGIYKDISVTILAPMNVRASLVLQLWNYTQP